MDDGRAHNDLSSALAGMRWRLEPGRFALCALPAPPGAEALALLAALAPAALVHEADETTLLVPEGRLAALRARWPEARVEEGLRWVRFEAPMAWDLVGFLAHVTGRLAAAGVPLGVVCGFRRDHVFVAERFLPAARRALEELFGPPLPAPGEGAPAAR